MLTRADDLKAGMALLVGAVSVAVAAATMSVTLDAGTVRAATQTRATVEATQFTVQSRQAGEAFAECPGNKRVVGGGVVQGGPSDGVFVQASGPLDATGVTLDTNDGDVAKQWYAAVSNFSATQRTYRVFALCSGSSTATVEATQFTVQGGQSQFGEAFAKCPGTRRALGGGVVQSGPAANIDVLASGPLDATGVTSRTVTGDVAKQWYAAVRSPAATPRIFRVFAICSGGSAATIKAKQFSIGSDNVESLARCARTKRALGGGVVQSGPADASAYSYVRASGPLDATGVTSNTNDGDVAKQWYAAVINGTTVQRTLKVFAICE